MTYLLLVVGLVLLVAGGEGFVRGSVAIAKRMGLSPLLIGLTLVGFGTSLPELVTSIQAALDEAPGIAFGNVVGSNIANILLILGVTALLYPVVVHKSVLKRDGSALVIASLVGMVIVLAGTLGRLAGLVLTLLLLCYLVFSYRADRKANAAVESEVEDLSGEPPVWLSLVYVFGGLVLTVLGARLLVSNAVIIATMLGVSETIIGLTIVAIGTSLPELVTAAIAALRRHTDLALGNVIGSNIFNLLLILGVTALIHPIPVPPEIIGFDIWIMLGATLLLLVFSYTGAKIKRWEGGVLLGGYVGYLGWLAVSSLA